MPQEGSEADLSQAHVLKLSAPGMPQVEIPKPGKSARTLDISLHTVPAVVLDCGDEVAKWLSQVLVKGSFRLAYLGDDVGCTPRQMCTQAAWNNGSEASSVYLPGATVGFADSDHVTLISDASLADLNRRMPRGAAQLKVDRFRMNILLSGTGAYEEEGWKSFVINGVDFQVSRLCNRCTVTLVDPGTGGTGPIKGEPLQLLRSFRSVEHLWHVDPRHNTAPILGIKACARSSSGSIRVGDMVTAVVPRGVNDRLY